MKWLFNTGWPIDNFDDEELNVEINNMVKDDTVDRKQKLAESAGSENPDKKFGHEDGRPNTGEPAGPSNVLSLFENEQEVLEGPIKVENA